MKNKEALQLGNWDVTYLSDKSTHVRHMTGNDKDFLR
jgi:hypothetical protein